MKILNPAYVEPVAAKDTKIRGVISALVAALPAGARGLPFAAVRAEVLAQFPALQFDQGDIHQAAVDLGYVVGD